MADPMSERHWLAIKRYVTNVRATHRDLRYAGRPMQHLVPLWDEAERLRAALDETTAARDGDLVRQLAEAWRERDAARAEVKRLRKELDQVRRAGEEELEYAAQRYAMADAMRGDACIERDQARAERDAARVGMEKLRGLHRGVCVGACGLDDVCECEEFDLACDECSASWPCATIRTLDGTEAGQ